MVPRQGQPPPCECKPVGYCKKKSLGLEELSPKNQKAYQRYLEARVLGPRDYEAGDELFRYNCSVIDVAERECESIRTSWSIWGRPEGKDGN